MNSIILVVALMMTPVTQDNQVINATNIGAGNTQIINQVQVNQYIEPQWWEPNPHEYLHRRPIIQPNVTAPTTINFQGNPYETRSPANSGSDRYGR
jgi:hypothetical protein